MTDQEALEDSHRELAGTVTEFETIQKSSRLQKLQRRLSVSTHHQMLHLHVVGCDNIKKVDIVGWSDPYCVVYANDTKIGKTPIIKNTKKPRWNEIFDIDLHYGHVELRFEVYDWDRVGSGDFHGMVLLDTDEMRKQYGRSNAKFELKPDPKKKPKNNKKVGGQLILSFSVMTDEAARKATEDERKALTAKKENDDQEEINVEEEMAKDATGMVEDHYDGPDITEVEEETPPPPTLSPEEEQQKLEEEKKQKIRDSYLQQQQLQSNVTEIEEETPSTPTLSLEEEQQKIRDSYLQQQQEKLQSNESDKTVDLPTKIGGDALNVVSGTKKVDDLDISVRDHKKVENIDNSGHGAKY